MTKTAQLLYKSYPEALDGLVQKLNAREFSFDEYHIVLCPDRYTQSVEQALFCGSCCCGAIDVEVLTLSRLSRRVAEKQKALGKEGCVMITARAIAAVADKLKYYGRAAGFSDFARETYETLQQIISSDVTPEECNADGVTKAKLADLALIKAEYDRIKADFSDPADRLTALIDGAPYSPLIENSHFYAIGYADTTKLNLRVFSEIAKYAKSFHVFTAAKPTGKRDDITLFRAADRVDEYKEIALDIRSVIAHGGHYSDCAVVCDSPRALRRILTEYLIPSYTDETRALFVTPPLVALECLYKLRYAFERRNAIDCESLVTLCKNPFVDIAAEDSEMLLFEVKSGALSFVPKSFEFKSDGAKRAAQVGMGAVAAFGENNDFCAAALRALEYLDCAAKAERQRLETDCVTPILGLIDSLRRYGTGAFDIDARMFFSAAQSVNVNSVPRERDCVTVTMPQTLRLSSVKRLYVTHFNEGVMPPAIADTGLISDIELNALGGVIEPSVYQRNKQSRDELKAVVLNADSVFLTYSAASGKPATFINELGTVKQSSDYAEQRAALFNSDDIDFIVRRAAVPSSARELAARGMTKYGESLKTATQQSAAIAPQPTDCVGKLDKKTLSATELSHWFTCPYKRFLSDTVGIKERREGFGAPDFGIIVHEFMQDFALGDLDCSRDKVESAVNTILGNHNITLTPAEHARILDDAADFAEVNAKILKLGNYKVKATEEWVGGIKLGKTAELEFVGCIDRYDVCGNQARIMDYKTGNKKFELKECLNGCDMQLPLYACAVPYDVTGVFYVRQSKKYTAGGTPEQNMSGCLVKDVSVALDYDNTLIAGGDKSEIVPVRLKSDKGGGIVFDGRITKGLMDKAEFADLKKKCMNNADVAADEIAAGHIERSPVDKACERCPYIGICGGGIARVTDDDSNDGVE